MPARQCPAKAQTITVSDSSPGSESEQTRHGPCGPPGQAAAMAGLGGSESGTIQVRELSQ